jgi:two-component sensor histidine kinase
VARGFSLPLRLAILVAGTTLPLILFASNIVYRNYVSDRRDAEQRVLEVARGIRIAVDGELRSQISALRALALSYPLEKGDIVAFRNQAESFLNQFPDGSNLVLIDPTGQQILNMRVAWGEPLPRRENPANDLVFETGRPAVSDLVVGAVTRRLLVTINVPVFHGGKVAYDVAFTPPPRTFRNLALEQRPDTDWVISILDGNGAHIAREPDFDKFFGEKASNSLLPNISGHREGILDSVSLEGEPLITAFTTSQLSAWKIAVGMPRVNITTPLWQSLALTIVVGLLCVLIGLFFAIRMARSIAEAEGLQRVMLDELNHRIGNTLSIVQSIAAQTFGPAVDLAFARKHFDERIVALARAHSLLSDEKWKSADIKDIVTNVFEPYSLQNSGRLHVDGPSFRLSPRHALMVSMALHELATNAAKHGALSNDGGEIFIDWKIAETYPGRRLSLHWKEQGGPPIRNTGRKGFGSTLIEKFFVTQFGGKTSLILEDPGAVASFEFPHE